MADRDGGAPGASRRNLLRGGAVLAGATVLSNSAPAAAAPGPDGTGRKVLNHAGQDRGFPFWTPSVVNMVADFGARGDGVTDDTRAFELAYRYAASRVRDGIGRTVIDIPAGKFLVKRPHALLNGTAPPRPANGLRFRGAGKRMTQIVFQPETGPGSYLCRNEDVWANVMFEHMQFRSATPGASFFYSYSTGLAQDYRFSECEWMGEWEYGVALDGVDTNSEMRWDACRVGGSYRKAFLYSGLSKRTPDPQRQDQFLNYWFNDMKVEYEWGNFLEFPYGGSITCRGGSYLITGRRPVDTPEYGRSSTFFRFPQGQHHDSVQRFHAADIRFEVRDPEVLVIDCSWKGGTVRFSDCDDTAQAFKDFSGEVRPHRYAIGARGPLIRYDSCQLVGRHEYRTSAPTESIPKVARYDMCLIRSHTAVDFAVLDNAIPEGVVTFVDCIDELNSAAAQVPTPTPAPAPSQTSDPAAGASTAIPAPAVPAPGLTAPVG
ncbi:glycosyl hydrolase family 28-related protein [Streptomyces sp. NPDC051219]|uniref:glycosyl hydrolase family 28-related protein n=1 Tax=Streptomyces sp. NPDC051219 TaxID=3155283 RepID=UPI00341DEF08